MPNVRPLNSKKYKISSYRFTELRNFCLRFHDQVSPLLDKEKELILTTAKETNAWIAPYLMEAVTESATYNYLVQHMDIPCSKDVFYKSRREFYCLLDQRKREKVMMGRW